MKAEPWKSNFFVRNDLFMSIILFSNQLFSLAGAYWRSLIAFGRATLNFSILGCVTGFPKHLVSHLYCTIRVGQK